MDATAGDIAFALSGAGAMAAVGWLVVYTALNAVACWKARDGDAVGPAMGWATNGAIASLMAILLLIPLVLTEDPAIQAVAFAFLLGNPMTALVVAGVAVFSRRSLGWARGPEGLEGADEVSEREDDPMWLVICITAGVASVPILLELLPFL